jgi:hypothetical protein
MKTKYAIGNWLGKKNSTKIGKVESIEIKKHLGKTLIYYNTTVGTLTEDSAKLMIVK